MVGNLSTLRERAVEGGGSGLVEEGDRRGGWPSREGAMEAREDGAGALCRAIA
jgi:hypothetical protein